MTINIGASPLIGESILLDCFCTLLEVLHSSWKSARHMAKAVDALGYIHPVAVGQCCAAWSWSIGATSLARLAIMMMMHSSNPMMANYL